MLTTTEALAKELAAIRGDASVGSNDNKLRRRAGELNLSALCLSGGGIRSAAFCLGVMQALARARLLGQFDYLSTVSGGGYIGAWLQALIRQRGSVASAVDALCDRGEAGSALHTLRNYTSYLSPESGLFSTDLWADIVLYLRNVLLNLLVFLPILLAAVIAPILLRTFIWAMQTGQSGQIYLLAGLGIVLAFATCCSALGLPNHRLKPGIDSAADNPARDAMSPQSITRFIFIPFLAWAFLAPATLTVREPDWEPWIPTTVVVYAVALCVGFIVAGIRGAISRGDPHPGLFGTNVVAWLIATTTSSAVLWGGIALARMVPPAQQAEALAVVGPIWLAVSNGLHATVFVGLRRDGALFDMDREWLARLSAMKIRIGCLWAIFAFAAIAIPDALLTLPYAPPFWLTLVTPLASGPVAAWLGKQVSARVESIAGDGDKSWITKPLVLNILATLFILALMALLGYGMQRFLGWTQEFIGSRLVGHASSFVLTWGYDAANQPPLTHVLWPPYWLFAVQFAVAALLSGAIWVIDRIVNVNRYSMHAIYRNRLTRAFLGSARQTARKPDAFTEFDPNDALPLSILSQPHGEWRLFHIVNMTLNLTSGGPASWAERKAMAFTASALTCGAALLPRKHETTDQRAGVFVPTTDYAGREGRTEPTKNMKGLTLATAMTISGAAVSPNWGYHSSPVTAFLMTLFNVRLGAWLPNPATVVDPDLMSLGRPLHAVHPMVGDLLGSADATSTSIYLSDGGHFENLGIYEMLRRRCRMILVVDAGQDGDCVFEDLGNAIRKASIDQQIEISALDTTRILTREAEGKDHSAVGFATARVLYPEDFEPCGRLVYIKPSVLAMMPTDTLAYANLHKDFPHDPTPDQWFTESQFESYRHLGDFQMQMLIERMDGDGTLDRLFAAAFLPAETD